MLSIEKGRAIAKFVKTNIYNKEILYIDQDIQEDNKKLKYTIDDNDISLFLSNKRKSKDRLSEINILKKALKEGKEPDDKKFKDNYLKLKNKIDNQMGKSIIVDSGYLQQIPRPDTRECLYISAPSGAGKSTYTSNYCLEYEKLFPKNKIVLFSKLHDDEALDKIKNLIRVEINDDLINNITIDDLKDCLVIFDDCDTIQNKKYLDYINHLKDDILTTGRHYNIYCIITSHLINNYKSTRLTLNECSSITIFPNSGSAYAISYCLKNYIGLSKEDIKKIFKLPSRWTTIFKNYPQAVLYEKGCYLLSNDNI